MADLIAIREDVTRRNVLVTLEQLLEQMGGVESGDFLTAVMQSAMIPQYNLLMRQHFSRVKIERTAWVLTGAGYATNTWNWMPFSHETLAENDDVFRLGSPLWKGMYVCREDGLYQMDAWWKATISAPLVNVAQLYEAELGYVITRKNVIDDTLAQKFDAAAPVVVQHLGGTPYFLVDIKVTPPTALRRPYLEGWHVSGADTMRLRVGDVVYVAFKMNGNVGDIEFFEYFAARATMARVGDLLTGEECC